MEGFNQIINVICKRYDSPSPLIINTKFVSDSNEVADKFNEYFSTIAEKIQSKIHLTGTDFMQF